MSAVRAKKQTTETKLSVAEKASYIKKNQLILLKGLSKRPETQLTSFEKIKMIKEGIPKKALEELKEKTGLDYDALSTVLSVARATLINKKGDARFDSSLSERIMAIADIYSFGYEVFEDVEKFNRWISRPIRALGWKAPFQFLDTEYGRQEVKNIIGRILYGVFS